MGNGGRPSSRSRRMYVDRGYDHDKYRRVARSHPNVLPASVFAIARTVHAANVGEITVGTHEHGSEIVD